MSWLLRLLGHTFVVTSDKEGPTSVFERELPMQHDHLTTLLAGLPHGGKDREGKDAEASITSGIGSDHVDLEAAIKHWSRSLKLLIVIDQRIRACGDDDLVVDTQLHSVLSVDNRRGWNIANCVSRSYISK